jgi:hypothetical protein
MVKLNPIPLDSEFCEELITESDDNTDYDTPLDEFQTYILSVSENIFTLDQLRTLTPENIKELTLQYTFQNIYS